MFSEVSAAGIMATFGVKGYHFHFPVFAILSQKNIRNRHQFLMVFPTRIIPDRVRSLEIMGKSTAGAWRRVASAMPEWLRAD